MSVADVTLSPIHKESKYFHGYYNNNQRGHVPEDSSILIYLIVGGSFILMRVLESDSIASVKLRIQTCKGFVVKKKASFWRQRVSKK